MEKQRATDHRPCFPAVLELGTALGQDTEEPGWGPAVCGICPEEGPVGLHAPSAPGHRDWGWGRTGVPLRKWLQCPCAGRGLVKLSGKGTCDRGCAQSAAAVGSRQGKKQQKMRQEGAEAELPKVSICGVPRENRPSPEGPLYVSLTVVPGPPMARKLPLGPMHRWGDGGWAEQRACQGQSSAARWPGHSPEVTPRSSGVYTGPTQGASRRVSTTAHARPPPAGFRLPIHRAQACPGRPLLTGVCLAWGSGTLAWLWLLVQISPQSWCCFVP